MINYSAEEHNKYLQKYFYVVIAKSLTDEETVTKENFETVLEGLRENSINEEFHRNYAALRMLYFQKHIMESIENE
jgi:hypothetical protein